MTTYSFMQMNRAEATLPARWEPSYTPLMSSPIARTLAPAAPTLAYSRTFPFGRGAGLVDSDEYDRLCALYLWVVEVPLRGVALVNWPRHDVGFQDDDAGRVDTRRRSAVDNDEFMLGGSTSVCRIARIQA